MSLEELNKARKKVRNFYFICILVILVGFLLFFWFDTVGVAIVIASVLAMIIVGKKMSSGYKASYKKIMVENTLKEHFDHVMFEPNRGLDSSILSETKMIRMGNRYRSDDYLSAQYNGVNFIQADVCIEHHYNTGKESHTETLFQGRWMIFDFNKNFSCNLQVREVSFRNALNGGTLFDREGKMHKVEMEDVEFEKYFNVYTEDDHQAFYIMTPQIMERMKTLKMETKGDIMLCFIGGQLHVAINSGKNSFEPPIFRNIDPEKTKNEVVKDLKLITSFIDGLKLDVNIFK